MLTGKALIDDIDRTEPADGELAFWWLGQHGFVLKLGGAVLYLDPYLSDSPSRTVRPLLAPEDVTHADVVTGSHDHGDHIDRAVWPGLATGSPEAKFLVPRLILRRGLAGDLALARERFVGLDDGEAVDVAGVRITGVAAAHERLDVDGETGLHPYLGFVIEGHGCRVYHAGDTCRYEGLETRLKAFGGFDAVFVPINGRDAERLKAGCIGNMTYQEAVDLAGEIDTRVAVAAHFEMFEHNGEDPRKFVEYMNVKFPAVTPLVPQHGRRVVLRKGADPETTKE
jgi:L-ascorbate metabolism protein UlaG (beta-lactamase superfamily)